MRATSTAHGHYAHVEIGQRVSCQQFWTLFFLDLVEWVGCRESIQQFRLSVGGSKEMLMINHSK